MFILQARRKFCKSRQVNAGLTGRESHRFEYPGCQVAEPGFTVQAVKQGLCRNRDGPVFTCRVCAFQQIDGKSCVPHPCVDDRHIHQSDKVLGGVSFQFVQNTQCVVAPAETTIRVCLRREQLSQKCTTGEERPSLNAGLNGRRVPAESCMGTCQADIRAGERRVQVHGGMACLDGLFVPAVCVQA